MEVKTSKIIDFWVYWNRLVKLTYPSYRPKDCMATCTNWNEQSKLKIYEGKIFEFPIIINKKSRQKEEVNEKSIDISNSKLKEEIEERLEWQIWSLQIDLEKNLQWLYWSRTFCFDWLIWWIYTNSTCPNWRIVLRKDQIRPNNELRRFIGMMEDKRNKSMNVLCKTHNVECSFIWESCDILIWNKCIVQQSHKDHNVAEIEDSINDLISKTTEDLSNNESELRLKKEATNSALFLEQTNNNIFETILSCISQSIDNIGKEFKEKMKPLTETRIKYEKSITEFETNEELFNLFKNTKDVNLIEKVSKSFKEVKWIKKEHENFQSKIYEEIKHSEALKIKNWNWNWFSIHVSKLFSWNKEEIKLSNNSYISITFLNEKLDNEADILINSNDMSASQIYWSLVLEENIFCSFSKRAIKKVSVSPDPVKYGKLKLKMKPDVYKDSDTANFWFLLWECDKDFNSNIIKIEEHIVDRIAHELKDKENKQAESSSEEERIAEDDMYKGEFLSNADPINLNLYKSYSIFDFIDSD